jgi:IS30 family transposase
LHDAARTAGVSVEVIARERRAKLRKLVRFSYVRQSVIERILHGWSPQQIAGRMRLERHPVSISHETIYKFAVSLRRQSEQTSEVSSSIHT